MVWVCVSKILQSSQNRKNKNKTLFHPFGYHQSLFVFVSTQHALSGREYNGIIISWAIDLSKCVLECESVCIRKHKHDFSLRAVVALQPENAC